MIGGSTLKSGSVCMASHRLGYWQASTNTNSPQAYGIMSSGWSLLCWWWTILALNTRENKLLNTSLMLSLITKKLLLTGLFVDCHSSGITLTDEFIYPFWLTCKNFEPLLTCHTITITTCSASTCAHQIWHHSTNSPSGHVSPTITC